MKISLVQMSVTADRDTNRARALELARSAIVADAPDLVVLPEMSAFMSADPAKRDGGAETIDGAYAQALAGLAADMGVNLCLGSILERRGDRYFNTSVIFGRDGQPLGQYSKIHRFDVTLPNGAEVRESALVDAGSEVVVRRVDGVPVGFAICYDLRFAELFRHLVDAGAKLILLPSAFVQPTGLDHWEVLVRARAIETQCYVAAPNQIGQIDGGPTMFAHSIIVDPWGQVVAQMSNREGHVTARLAFDYLEQVRQRIPVHTHRVLA
jgi:nitrilase